MSVCCNGLCYTCLSKGFCQKMVVEYVDDQTLSDPEYLRDLRAFVRRYAIKNGVSDAHWADHALQLYCNFWGWVRGRNGEEVFLDVHCFDHEAIREWFRDFVQIVPGYVQPRLREETKERVRFLATMMRAYFPKETMMFGVRAANDN